MIEKKIHLNFLVALTCMFFTIPVFAQNITPEMIEQAKKAGITQDQINSALGKQSSNSLEQPKVSKSSLKKEKDGVRLIPQDSLDMIYRIKFRVQDSLKIDSLKKSNAVFGREIFYSKDLTFIPSFNIATPKNYKLGPGDELVINVYGASEENFTEKISPDGRIVIPNIGPVVLAGLTIEGAESKLKNALSKIYAGLRSGGTHLTLSIGNIRSIKVNIVGEVVRPGTFTLPSLATLFNALYAAGGINEIGSLRSVKVYRNSKLVGDLDVYDYLLNGKFDSNVRIEDNDMIVITPYESIVKVSGGVKRPRLFEMKKGETLSDAIRFAGGFKAEAYSNNVTIERSNGRNLEIHTVDKPDYGVFKVADGDKIAIGKIVKTYSNRLEIKGAVHRPGIFALNDRVNTLKQLLNKAEGVRGDAFLTRASITRTLPDSSKQMIAVDLHTLLNSDEDIPLENKDVFYIPSIYDLQEKFTVSIFGAVDSAAAYPYKKGMTVEDLIVEAGGLTYNASMQRVEVSRRIRDPYSLKPTNKSAETYTFSITEDLKISNEGKSFILEPFDEVFIRTSPGYERQQNIEILGEVAFGGKYTLSSKGQRLSDIIKMAGLTSQAYVQGARLIRKMNHDDSLRVITLLKLASHTRKDSIDKSKLDIGSEYFVGINLPEALANPGSEADVVLKEGDVINVPQYNSTVKISGAVLYPNTVTYSKKTNLKSYIAMAGGYGDRAKKGKTFVIYMNGTVAKGRSSKIEPGCEIVVPSKPDRRGTTMGEMMGIASSTASIAAMIATILK